MLLLNNSSWSLFTPLWLCVAGLLDSSQLQLSLGACFALGEIGRNGSLPLPDGTGDATTGADGKTTQLSKSDLVSKLIGKVQSTKENIKVCCFCSS